MQPDFGRRRRQLERCDVRRDGGRAAGLQQAHARHAAQFLQQEQLESATVLGGRALATIGELGR
jgi:hypothetical protein